MKTEAIFGVLLVLILVGAGTYYLYTHPITPMLVAPPVATTTVSEATSTPMPMRIAPPGYLEYQSTLYHFSLFYPNTLAVQEYKERGTTMTVTFEATDGSNDGFQIFIVPYGESQITAARLKQDIPSGVIDQETNILIDGKPAIMFYGTDAILGDTREVWFINHGFLYEVTTYKQLDSWLAGIMQTWQFD